MRILDRNLGLINLALRDRFSVHLIDKISQILWTVANDICTAAQQFLSAAVSPQDAHTKAVAFFSGAHIV
jgi:hypothetical protein